MKKIVLLITIQILCMHSFVVNAQRIFSTSYTMDDGLAANRVYSILQDSCGFMWFGTDDGLSRFDGIAFKNYYLSEYINATTSNSVKKIFIDRRGRMWIGLDTGIVIYDSKTDTLPDASIATIICSESVASRRCVSSRIFQSARVVMAVSNRIGVFAVNSSPTVKLPSPWRS